MTFAPSIQNSIREEINFSDLKVGKTSLLLSQNFVQHGPAIKKN